MTAAYVCASAGPRGIVHAVALTEALRARNTGGMCATTICGVGRSLVAHRVVSADGEVDDVAVATWPPPVADRCAECAARLGTRNAALGSAHWQGLMDSPKPGRP